MGSMISKESLVLHYFNFAMEKLVEVPQFSRKWLNRIKDLTFAIGCFFVCLFVVSFFFFFFFLFCFFLFFFCLFVSFLFFVLLFFFVFFCLFFFLFFFLIRKYVLAFLHWFLIIVVLLQCENFRNILNKYKLLKTCTQTTCPIGTLHHLKPFY